MGRRNVGGMGMKKAAEGEGVREMVGLELRTPAGRGRGRCFSGRSFLSSQNRNAEKNT